MSKYQRPIRNVHDELFDVEWDYQKNEEVHRAYADFWATLDDMTAIELDLLLL